MSSEQSLDPHLIEQTKQQIRNLVNEIAQLSRSRESRRRTSTRSSSPASSPLWRRSAAWSGPRTTRVGWRLQYQINLQETRLATKSEDDQIRHGRLLHKVMTTGEGLSGSAAIGRGRRRLGRQSDRLSPGARAAEDRAGRGRSDRDLPAVRGRALDPEGLPAVPPSDVRSGRRLPQEPAVAELLRPPGAVDAAGGVHAAGPREAQSPRHGLHDCQRGTAADRVRPRERGASARATAA